ncbi:DUF4352 domain-containing protein [Actinocorallia sp. B10E7]|uniref:DUF4352 domain-containing protein n=1 Tax=Actinocorallia sp. B10E7 TaxID=3153558 RepID=UPI00325CB3B5
MAEKGSWDEGGGAGREPGRDRAAPEVTSGASAEGKPPKKGFNPAWLLVPALGLLLGGMGIASMNRGPAVETAPTVTVTGPTATVVRPVAPVGSSTTAPGCGLTFLGTSMRPPVPRIQNDQTGGYLDAPSGQVFVVVDTTLTNSGTEDCYATAGYQRAYTSGDAYRTGDAEAGGQLSGGRAVTQPIQAGKSVKGTYVFQVPAGSQVSSVRLRSNGSERWTIVNAG